MKSQKILSRYVIMSRGAATLAAGASVAAPQSGSLTSSRHLHRTAFGAVQVCPSGE
jgi:hypothetical protein